MHFLLISDKLPHVNNNKPKPGIIILITEQTKVNAAFYYGTGNI